MSYNNKTFEPKVTAKGTELPILNLKGKPYLQVAHRLVWFREESPDAEIRTSVLKLEDTYAVVKAEIIKEGKVIGSGHKKETEDNFPDFIEKAETGAIGRALAMAGYGTQFEPELDEGNRLADSPIETPKRKGTSNDKPSKMEEANKASATANVPEISGADTGTTDKLLKLQELARSYARIADKKGKISLEGFKTALMDTYQVDKVKDLNEDQLNNLIERLKSMVE